jgi:hypothetical protein
MNSMEKRIYFPLPGTKPRAVQLVASRYTDWSIQELLFFHNTAANIYNFHLTVKLSSLEQTYLCHLRIAEPYTRFATCHRLVAIQRAYNSSTCHVTDWTQWMINVSLGIVAKKGTEISRSVRSYHTPISVMAVTMLYTILKEINVNVLCCYWLVKKRYAVCWYCCQVINNMRN